MEFEDDVFEDAFEDERYEDERSPDLSYTSITMKQFELEQPFISLKDTRNIYTVDRNLVNSKLFHDKFESLQYFGVNRGVRESLYRETGRLLEFVDGQEQERMVAINSRTGSLIVDNFSRDGKMYKTGFNERESQLVRSCTEQVALIHNHSLNGRPSIQDLLTYAKEDQIALSLVACHNGTLYVIYGVNPEIEGIYMDYLRKEKQVVSNIDEANQLATTRIYQLNDLLGNRHKLIKFKRI